MFTSTDNRVVLPGFTRVDGAVFFDVTSKLGAVNKTLLYRRGRAAVMTTRCSEGSISCQSQISAKIVGCHHSLPFIGPVAVAEAESES